MRKVRIGIVGLGSIAQKAYLPILTRETDWTLVGAYSPSEEKRKRICKEYRMQEYHQLHHLMDESDALFIHSSTESHYEVVSLALQHGVDVYVDKPLAATVEEAEELVELSKHHQRKLMVGFNRRFAPMYVEAKKRVKNLAWIRFDKHRANSVGPNTYDFTMLDDYLHLVDTARWLANGDLTPTYQQIQVNEQNQLLYASHLYESNNKISFHTSMHRKAGTSMEQLELVGEDAIIRVKNMSVMEIEENNQISTKTPPSWETVLKQRGFEDAIKHFIDCLNHDHQPAVDGEEALKSQILIEK
ncbi:gfo/Idh/MocA family oxidoreductase [Ornithinibacillus sp. L9]|uniref:Gfo/Idh/MocA family oxidoreductase n=1 Tax=Ornithinibacillus caprae TaxID=2678566 RepID=A0A6N8FDV7_9BACI|nr:Gfo/Idh/MocA family oxidoreductase [Ornithinibacillus caprae]MUK87710.1 gfo/Idh/MocA family oxidoreductase [Ornithinibacillus caprae]